MYSFQVTQARVETLPPSLLGCVTLGESPALSELDLAVLAEVPHPSPGRAPHRPSLVHFRAGTRGHSLAVRRELEVIGAHLEEVEELGTAGDLDRQAHEGIAVLGEGALAALGGPLPVEPPWGWRGPGGTAEAP